MAVGIEAQAAPEARLPRKLFVWCTLKIGDEPPVGFDMLLQHIRK